MGLSMLLVSAVHAAPDVEWNSQTHTDYYMDVDGDGTKDLLLQPKTAESSLKLFKGDPLNFTIHYKTDRELRLPEEEPELFEIIKTSKVVTGYFNDDHFEDALIMSFADKKAYLLLGSRSGLVDFRRFNANQFEILNRSGEEEFYTGDFDGNGRSELLVLFPNSGRHRVFQTDENGVFSHKQTLRGKARWGVGRSEKLYIGDFNGDGRDDIFALARKKNKKHFVMYANENGKFKNKNTIPLKENFADIEWNSDEFETAVMSGDSGDELVRFYNRNGGVDTRGRFIPDGRDPLRFKKCKRMSFRPKDKRAENSCKPRKKKKRHKRHKRLNSASSVSATTATTYSTDASSDDLGSDDLIGHEPDAINYSPQTVKAAPVSSVGAYPKVNEQFTLSWNASSNATKYELWVSYDKGQSIENTYVYTTQTSLLISEDYAASRFYYIKACNATGCSGLSPYRSVFIYDKPEPVTTFFSVQRPTVLANASISLMWERPKGIIGTGGYYIILETAPDGTTQQLPTVYNGDVKHTSVTLNKGEGQYNYKIMGCNKSSNNCSEYSAAEANIAVIPPDVANSDITLIRNLTYNPVSIAIGNTQEFEFDYFNATWCHNSLDVDYIGNSNSTNKLSGRYNWEKVRTEADIPDGESSKLWEFTVYCKNKNTGDESEQGVRGIIYRGVSPVAIDDRKSVGEDESAVIRVLDNDFDDDGHTFTITGYTQPSLGSVTCGTTTCTYTAPQNTSGGIYTDFTYTINDTWNGDATAQVDITVVSGTPDPAVQVWSDNDTVYAPSTVNLGEEQEFSFHYENVRKCWNDAYGSEVVYVSEDGMLHSGTYTWSRTREVANTWDFDIKCQNEQGIQSIHAKGVINENRVPIAGTDTVSVYQNVASTLDVLYNDSDEDNHSLTISSVSQPANGSAAISEDGKYVIYTSDANYTGSDSFTYSIDDGWGGETTGSVTAFVGVDPSNGLIVEYNFEDSSNLGKDTSGNGFDAQLDGTPSQAGGKIGYAMNTASGGLIDVPGFNKGQTVTFNFWFKTIASTASRPGYYGEFLIHQGYWDGGMPAWELRPMLDGQSLRVLALGDDGVNRDIIDIWDYGGYRDNNWHMLTMVTNGVYLTSYIDGAQLGSDYSTGPASWSKDQVKSARTIGVFCYYGYSDCKNGTFYFNGEIDNYRMYGRALTQAEVTELYQESINSAPTGEVTISGSLYPGSTLSASNTIADEDGLGEFSYQWIRHKDGNSFDIAGAVSADYVLTTADAGYQIGLKISYTDGYGKFSVVSSDLSNTITVAMPAISNLTIQPSPLVVGSAPFISFDYQRATSCFDKTNPSNVFVEGGLSSGTYSTSLPADYVAAGKFITVVCESGDNAVEASLGYIVEKLSTPTLEESFEYEKAVEWSQVEGATHYQLQIKKQNEFSWENVGDPTTNQSGSVTNYIPATYSLRVGACIEEPGGAIHCGENISEYSNEINIEFAILFPVLSIDKLDVNSYRVSWTDVNASEYELEEKEGNGAWKTVLTQSNTSATYLQQPSGVYEYRVRGCYLNGCGGYSAVQSFVVEEIIGQCLVD